MEDWGCFEQKLGSAQKQGQSPNQENNKTPQQHH